MSARTGKPNGFRPSNPVDAFRISVGHSSMRFSNRGARAGVEACPYRTSLAIWNAFSGTNPPWMVGPPFPPVLADFSKRFSETLKPFVGAGISACPFGVSVIAARGQAWDPAPTGLRSKSGIPVQRQILCVGADRRVRPHRETKRIQSIEHRKCLSYFRWPLVGAGLCACPFGISLIAVRG